MSDLTKSFDSVLNGVVEGNPRVPGVVAMVTDRKGNIYEGAAGVRDLSTNVPMTTDSVFAIFSTTKAITGTCVLQCVEEGLLDLDAPAKNYAPALGKLQVLDGFDDAGNPITRAPKRDVTTRMLILLALDTIFLMLSTTALPKIMGNLALLRLREDQLKPHFSSIQVISGNMEPILIGLAKLLRESAANASVK